MQDDDLDIDDLLLAVSVTRGRPTRRVREVISSTPLEPGPLEYFCTGCSRTYKGTAINSTDQNLKRRYVSMCPRCFHPNEKLWWLHHYLDLKEVIEPVKIQSDGGG